MIGCTLSYALRGMPVLAFACKKVLPLLSLAVNLFLALNLSISIAFAGEVTVYGPESFTRSSGTSSPELRSFIGDYPETEYTLRIYNGGMEDNQETGELVSSSTVVLNGNPLAGQSNFNQTTTQLEIPVFLLSGQNNLLEVELFGKPGGLMTVEIVGVDNEPPLLRFINPAGGELISNPRPEITLEVSDNFALDTDSLQLSVNGFVADASCSVAGATATCLLDADLPAADITMLAVIADQAGNTAQAVVDFSVGQDVVLPPDPASIAPTLDSTVETDIHQATTFLYTGDNPVQTDVSPDTIIAERVAVLRGKVLKRDGEPLSGVTVTIKNHAEFGQTLTRADGIFDLVINGGDWTTVVYEREGYLPVQRQIETPWRDYAWLPDVVMIPLDDKVAEIALSDTSQPFQIAQGSSVTDDDGTRQATVLFPSGTSATLMMPDGSEQPIANLSVRATEYTVGSNGPKAMPGELPESSAYTYAVELSVDEAIAAEARSINFSQPLPVYVNNFLDFPVGVIVPSGWYDTERSAWIPSDNGLVIEILAVNDGLALIDIAGNGEAASDSELNLLGITQEEQRELAGLFSPGATFWRVPVTHFTSWDFNMATLPVISSDATPPPGPDLPDISEDPEPDDEDCESGCVIDTLSQVLGEDIPIAGTEYALHYRSDQTKGYANSRKTVITLSKESVPASLQYISLQIAAPGKTFDYRYEALPNQTHTFEWDGSDAYGREHFGTASVSITIGYHYQLRYVETTEAITNPAFSLASPTGGPIGRGRDGSYIKRINYKTTLYNPPKSKLGVSGWGITPLHQFTPSTGALTTGRGDRYNAASVTKVVAEAADVPYLTQRIAIMPNGDILGVEELNHVVRRYSRENGEVVSSQIFAGWYGCRGCDGYSGDGGPAEDSRLRLPSDVAWGEDGSIYIVDRGNNAIRKVDGDGIITTVAGDGSNGSDGYGDYGPAVEARFDNLVAVAVAKDGTFYVADNFDGRIRKIRPDGTITTFAGCGSCFNEPVDGAPAKEIQLSPKDLSIGPDGAIYTISDAYILKIDPQGILHIVGGTGDYGYSGDGGLAKEAALRPLELDIADDGTLYFTNYLTVAGVPQSAVRKIDQSGVVTTWALNSPNTPLSRIEDVEIGADGLVYVSSGDIKTIRPAVKQALSELYLVPSKDGSELYHFDQQGRHIKTTDTLTGRLIVEFSYNPDDGSLTGIIDNDGNTLNIEYSTSMVPSRIVSADGITTYLTPDFNGHLQQIRDPEGGTHRFTYDPNGLLLTHTNPRESSTSFSYNDDGKLISDLNELMGGWQLARSKLENGYQVEMTSAEGRTSTYKSEYLPVGTEVFTTIKPDGTQRVKTRDNTQVTTVTYPDGTVSTSKYGPDPRFGMLAPLLVENTLTTPSLLSMQATHSRSVSLSNQWELLSLEEQIDTYSVNNRVSTVTYSALDNQITRVSPEGRMSSIFLDDAGKPTMSVMPGFHSISYTYDWRGRLNSITQGDRTTAIEYDANGYIWRVTDPLLQASLRNNDLLGRVQAYTDPGALTVNFAYDANSNLTAVTPPGKEAHDFDYSALDSLVAYHPPILSSETTSTHYTYNQDQQIEQILRPDNKNIYYDYDPAGRISSITIPRGTLNYSFASTTGQLTAISTPEGQQLDYHYDGALLTQIISSGSVQGSVSFSYDNNFWVTGLNIDGSNFSYGYDNDGLLTQAGDLLLTRDPQNGYLTDTALAGITSSLSYNGYGERQTETIEHGTNVLYDVVYLRDDLGRIQEKTETVDGVTITYSYHYDTSGHLDSVAENGTLVADYSYDSNGNRNGGFNRQGAINAIVDEQDRLTSYNGVVYQYSANGDLHSKTEGAVITTYQYDALGNLLSVSLPGDITIDYIIDGANRRVGKKINGVLTQGFLYQDQLNPVAELDGDNNVISRFIYGSKINVPDYMIKGGVTYRIISDHLGSPRLVVNAQTGEIQQRMDYDEYGNVIADTNPGFQPFGFAGGLYDLHTELTRFGARDYDAAIGRWTVKDPIGFEGGQGNLYVYVNNGPVDYIDPTGLICFDFSQFVDQIRENRSPLAADLASLTAALTLGTMSKTPAELRSLGQAKNQINPTTSQLSRWNGRLARVTNGASGRFLRNLGRTTAGVWAGAISTAALIGEGFYNLGVIGQAAYDATSAKGSEDCGCE